MTLRHPSLAFWRTPPVGPMAGLLVAALIGAGCTSPRAESSNSVLAPGTATGIEDSPDLDAAPEYSPDFDAPFVTIAPLPSTTAPAPAPAPGPAPATATTTTEPLTGWDAFDDSLRRRILGGGSTALSVAVAVDGDIVHRSAMGLKRLNSFEPVQTKDRFRIASISKTIASIVVLRLVEQGELTLDDPVGGWIAGGLGVAQPSARSTDITVRELLTHTSGFGQYENLFFRHQVDTCRDAAIVAFTRPLSSTPGGGFRYSNMNFCVLGLLVEQVTGKPYEEVAYEQLLTPLGISGMRMAPTADLGPDEVEHRTTPGRDYMEVLGAAGAWVATPSDLVTIIDSLDADTPGWKPLAPATVAAMRTSANNPSVPDRGYGMGLILYGNGNVGHTGTIESTHAMVLDRSDNVTWALTVSGNYPDHTPRLAGFVDDALLAGGFIAG